MKAYYRKDIDGLRAVCVFLVIFYHLGVLPGGSIDVFFVISGFLITSIIRRKRSEGTFSLKEFYIKRVRRIFPMLLLITAIVLGISCFVMLPDDLENVAESVVATNLFTNNVLFYLTEGSYWATASKFKPLLHTWTLSIEEQFYLLYPLFLLLFKNDKKLFRALVFLTVTSLLLYFFTKNSMLRYYFPHTRFFEIGAGALVSFAGKETKRGGLLRSFALMALMAFLFLNKFLGVPFLYKAPLIVAVTALFLLPAQQPQVLRLLLENRFIRGFGLMSYSLYMWHQPVFAFTRYMYNPHISGWLMVAVLLAIVLLSVASYHLIEQPFRDKKKISNQRLFGILGFLFLTTTGAGLYIYAKAGVVRDMPELDISAADAVRNMHAKYNDRIYAFDKNFTQADKIKVLIAGHSFARDWANVLLESEYKGGIELSYILDLNKSADARRRVLDADVIYFSPMDTTNFAVLKRKFSIDMHKVKITGMKNFGVSSGIFYSKRGTPGYCMQHVRLQNVFYRYNTMYKEQWADKYIDLMAMVDDKDGAMPVFTPDCKFISQDCKHFTKAGAAYYASLINGNLPELER